MTALRRAFLLVALLATSLGPQGPWGQRCTGPCLPLRTFFNFVMTFQEWTPADMTCARVFTGMYVNARFCALVSSVLQAPKLHELAYPMRPSSSRERPE